MATIFKVTGKNSGKDVSLIITDSQGRQYYGAQLGILTHFEVDADYTLSTTKSIINGGQEFHESLPHGAKAQLKFVRYNSALEDMETAYRTASQNGIQLSYTLQYQTVNRDGTINTRVMTDCKPHNWKLGAYSPDQDVTQGVDFISGDLESTGTGSGLFGS